MSDHLPQEVWFDIFTRLPVKTLLQIRCVSKSWYSLISNPSFITTHINRTVTNNNTHLLLARHYTEHPSKEHYTLHWDDETFGEHHLEIELPFKSRNSYFKVVGCCNGLICLSDGIITYKPTIILWNPTIRKWVTLPRPRDLYALDGQYDDVLGFGFDPKSNDYKVVRLVFAENKYGGSVIPPEVEVYTLSTGCWRSISAAGVQHPLVECYYSQAVVNGAIHWLGYDQKKWNSFNQLIVSFDIGDEVFGEMMLPDSLAAEKSSYGSVEAFGGLLSLFQYDTPKKSCCIWVMKEYGVVESWTKQFAINLQGGVGKALGLRKNGELILATFGDHTRDAELISYDPETQKVKDIGIRGAKRTFYVDSYLESLVLLKGENGVLRKQANSCDALTLQGRRRGTRRRGWN